MTANRMFELLGLDPIEPPQLIDDVLRMPRITEGSITPAATPEDQMAREIVAKIEREDGFHACAAARLRGAYDGDSEHRIALAAIRQLTSESQRERARESNKPRPSDK